MTARHATALAVAACVATVVATAAAAQAPPQPPASDPAPADRWEAPLEERARINPLAPTPQALQRGRFLYQKHCASCHGPLGKGDGPASAYWSHDPRDLTDAERQAQITDGEILWKITLGRKADGDVIMPGFRNSIPSEEDRWKVVLYVRTLGQQPR